MDRDVAEGAELVLQAIHELSRRPGLTVEVEADRQNWVQVIPVEHVEQPGSVSGFVVNFPERFGSRGLVDGLQEAGIRLPPDTALIAHEANSYGTLRVRADIPLVALALFVGAIIERIGGAAPGYELSVHIEYGF
jgi:hypothetical protein